ncbi:MAG: PUA domain-containing protein [Promethearchaeota archaeon]
MDPNYVLNVRKIKAIADYQFGSAISDLLLDDMEKIEIELSKNTNKIRHVFYDGELLLNLRPQNGLFTLTFLAAQKIIKNIKPPRLRVIVLNDISEFIRKGRNVFCKHVLNLDATLRPLDETIVVNENDELLALGRLKLPLTHVLWFKRGIAVDVRKGILSS